MNANTARRLRRNAAVLASLPVALLLMTGTASATGTSGDSSRPQPLSHADQNGTGANPGTLAGCGAYCSTRDGSPSLNGNGGGTATGKPCAGCVGKADNKNPQGQAPSGPVDHNNGYECDGNHGIGQGNPAHTGCTTPAVPPVVTPPVVTPPVVVPPVVDPPAHDPKPACTTDANMSAGAAAGCTPVTAGSGSTTGTTPVCTTNAAMAAGSAAGCIPATAGSGSTTGITTGTTPVSGPGTTRVCTTNAAMAAGSEAGCTPATAGSGGTTGTHTGTTTGTTTGTATGTPSGNGSGAVSGQSTGQPVLVGTPAQGLGSGAAAQSPAGLPFTGDNTGQLALFALVLVAAGGGLVIGTRRV